MVHMRRIYTRAGDGGSTRLGDGTELPKHHLRIAAFGTVDEASCAIGIAVAHGLPEDLEDMLRHVQNDLFDVGADLCVPGPGAHDEAGEKLRIRPAYTKRLEGWIDGLNRRLEPLNSFVLPGGELPAAHLHLARTICRRAERLVGELLGREEEQGRVNAETLRYLNRLSDLLFVLARVANDDGKQDVLWKPGAARD